MARGLMMCLALLAVAGAGEGCGRKRGKVWRSGEPRQTRTG